MAWVVGFISGAMIGVMLMALMSASRDTHHHDRVLRLREKEQELMESWDLTKDYRDMYKADGIKLAIKILEGEE